MSLDLRFKHFLYNDRCKKNEPFSFKVDLGRFKNKKNKKRSKNKNTNTKKDI